MKSGPADRSKPPIETSESKNAALLTDKVLAHATVEATLRSDRNVVDPATLRERIVESPPVTEASD
jgi:hypothetical protein